MSVRAAGGASKRNCINLRAAPATSASELLSGTLPHFGEIAARHLGVAAAGGDLRAIANLARRLRDGTAAGGKGSQAIKTRRAAAAASASAAARLRDLDILTVLDALAVPAPGEREALHQSSIIDLSKLALSERLDMTLLALDRLAAGVAASAARTTKLPRGAPRRPKALEIALDDLERVWWQHRQQAPTQSRNVGGFGAMAEAVLTAAPCNYGSGTVRKAVAAHLRRHDREALVASVAPQLPPTFVGSALLFSDGHELANELTTQLRAAGSSVATRLLPKDGTLIDAKEDSDLREFDLAVMVCLKEAPSDALRQRLQVALEWLRPRLKATGSKVLVIMQDPRAVAAAGGPDAYRSAPMSAAMVMLVGMWARELSPLGIHVSALFPGWGRDEQGQPNRHSQPRVTVEVLRETVSRLGARQQGRLTDLYGEPVP